MSKKPEIPGTPLMRQYLEVKSQHPESIVLFRMGDFFEPFNEDAKITAKIQNLTTIVFSAHPFFSK